MMKKSYPLAIAAMLAMMSTTAGAATTGPNATGTQLRFTPDFTTVDQKQKPNTLFGVNSITEDKFLVQPGVQSQFATRGAVDDTSGKFDGRADYEQLSTPDGMMYITKKLIIEYNRVNEYYTEEIPVGFEYTFYDKDFNYVGVIKDKVHIDEERGQTRMAPNHPVLNGFVSRHFFNDDDNLEFVFFIGIQNPKNDYHPDFYSNVYSLNGETDEEGNNKIVAQLPGRFFDSISTGGEATTLLSFTDDEYFTAADYPDPVERANHTTTHFTMAGRNADGQVEVLFTKDIYMASYPGDTTNGMYIITKVQDGVPYFVFQHYEEPYFYNPLGGAEDERARHNNNFVIEVYKWTGTEMVPVSTTKVPVQIDEAGDQLRYYFYSIGDLTWRGDIDMSYNGTPERPAFILNTSTALAADLENVSSTYTIIDTDGNKIRDLAVGSESFRTMNSAGSNEPHIMFIVKDEYDEYYFNFVDLYSGNVALSISQLNGGDPLSSTCERIKGEDGKYKYGFVMSYMDWEEYNSDTYKYWSRIAWFDQDGTLERIDKRYVGPYVQAATVDMQASSLNPYLYDDDNAMEYGIMVTRIDADTQLAHIEFLIVDDTDKWYAQFSAADGRGDPKLFTAVPDASGRGGRLYMMYDDGKGSYNIDVYKLPFENLSDEVDPGFDEPNPDFNGIDSVFGDFESDVRYENGWFIAEGANFNVYSASGMKVANGKNKVSVNNLAKGVYILSVEDISGKVKNVKITR